MPALGMLPSPLCPSLWFPMPAGQLQLGCLEPLGASPGCFSALCPAWAGTGMQNRRLVQLHPACSTTHLCSCSLWPVSPPQGGDRPEPSAGDCMARWSCQAEHQEPSEMLHPTSCATSTPACLHNALSTRARRWQGSGIRDSATMAAHAAHEDLLFQGPPHPCLLLQDCQLLLPSPFSWWLVCLECSRCPEHWSQAACSG